MKVIALWLLSKYLKQTIFSDLKNSVNTNEISKREISSILLCIFVSNFSSLIVILLREFGKGLKFSVLLTFCLIKSLGTD